MNTREINRDPTLPFAFFTFKRRRRFKPSEIVVSEVMATLSDLKWLRKELEEIGKWQGFMEK